MMLCTVKYYDSISEKSCECHDLVFTNSFAEAARILDDAYGEELEEILGIYPLSGDEEALEIPADVAVRLKEYGKEHYYF